jgi:hypothetical protein
MVLPTFYTPFEVAGKLKLTRRSVSVAHRQAIEWAQSRAKLAHYGRGSDRFCGKAQSAAGGQRAEDPAHAPSRYKSGGVGLHRGRFKGLASKTRMMGAALWFVRYLVDNTTLHFEKVTLRKN